METIMRIECENCHDVVEVTAKTVVAPFICSVCVNDATPCTEACCTGFADKGEYIDYTAVAAAMSTPEHDACDTASVENTTLLIEDLQQQLADERASIIALEAENAKLKQDYVERQTQIQNQADIIKEQEGHIDQDLRAIVRLTVELLDERNLRQHRSIALYQEQRRNFDPKITSLRDLAIVGGL
jgi:hypothetical protein